MCVCVWGGGGGGGGGLSRDCRGSIKAKWIWVCPLKPDVLTVFRTLTVTNLL